MESFRVHSSQSGKLLAGIAFDRDFPVIRVRQRGREGKRRNESEHHISMEEKLFANGSDAPCEDKHGKAAGLKIFIRPKKRPPSLSEGGRG